MQSGSNPPPTDLSESIVETFRPPHIALHGADDPRAIGQKVVTPTVQQRVPGVVVRQFDLVDGVRFARSQVACRRDDLWPLRPSARQPFAVRVPVTRCDRSSKLAIHDLGRVEIFIVTDSVRKNHASLMSIEPVIVFWQTRIVRQLRLGDWDRFAILDQSVHESVSHIAELDESASPELRKGQ